MHLILKIGSKRLFNVFHNVNVNQVVTLSGKSSLILGEDKAAFSQRRSHILSEVGLSPITYGTMSSSSFDLS